MQEQLFTCESDNVSLKGMLWQMIQIFIQEAGFNTYFKEQIPYNTLWIVYIFW